MSRQCVMRRNGWRCQTIIAPLNVDTDGKPSLLCYRCLANAVREQPMDYARQGLHQGDAGSRINKIIGKRVYKSHAGHKHVKRS